MSKTFVPVPSPQSIARSSHKTRESTDSSAPSIRNFSTGMAAKQVFGAEQKQYKKQLIALKTRNESENSSSHVMQQEDLQDWLDNLQFRLSEACNMSHGGTPPGTGGVRSSMGLPLGTGSPASGSSHNSSSSGQDKRPGGRRTNFFNLTDSGRSDDSSPKDATSFRGASKQGVGGRSRSTNNLNDAFLSALTDSEYLEELQDKIQKDSISSLHERLAERKVKEQEPKPKTGARPKALPKPKKKKLVEVTERIKSTKSSDESDSVTSVSSSRSADSLNNYVKHRAQITSKGSVADQRSPIEVDKFFDQSEKVDDIYSAAALLILPPARREVCAEVEEVGERQSPVLHLADDVEVEDFWETQKSIGKQN